MISSLGKVISLSLSPSLSLNFICVGLSIVRGLNAN